MITTSILILIADIVLVVWAGKRFWDEVDPLPEARKEGV